MADEPDPGNVPLTSLGNELWGGLRAAIELFRQNRWEDTRPLHQLRVILRRASVAVLVWRDWLPYGAFPPLDQALRELRRCTGRARDLDVRRVFLERLLSDCNPRHLAVVDLLYERATLDREGLQPRLLRQLARFERQLPQLPASLFLVHPHSALPDAQGDQVPAASQLLRAQIVASLEDLPGGKEDLPIDLHRLRLDLKRLRYRLELLAELEPELLLDASRHSLRLVQGSLGDHHDAKVARAELRALRRHWNHQRHRRRWIDRPEGLFTWRELRAGFRYLRRQYRRQRDSALKDFLANWKPAVWSAELSILNPSAAPQSAAAGKPSSSATGDSTHALRTAAAPRN